MQNSTFCRRIPVVQGDTARTFRFILEDITLDGTEHARIYARKPSGAEIYDECDVIGSNEVIFTPETEQIFIETGIIPAEIRVAKGEKLITSYSFEFEVRQSTMRTGYIPSSDEFNVLERAIEEAKGLHEPEFTEAGKRENIVSGETMQILFGKIKKWFTDLGALITKIGNKDISSIGDGTVTGAITDLDKRSTKNTSDIDVERKRIDNIAKLPEGSTAGDAELADIRVAADGTVYDTAGESVRGQINQIDQKYEKETGSLKEDVDNLTVVTEIKGSKYIQSGAYINGAFENGSYDSSKHFDVTGCKKIKAEIHTDQYYDIYDFVDSSFNVLSFEREMRNDGTIELELSVPKNAKYFVLSGKNMDDSVVVGTFSIKNEETLIEIQPVSVLNGFWHHIKNSFSYLSGYKYYLYDVREYKRGELKSVATEYTKAVVLLDENNAYVEDYNSNEYYKGQKYDISINLEGIAYVGVSVEKNVTPTFAVLTESVQSEESNLLKKSIVWLGTSIPAGGLYGLNNEKSYPKRVGKILSANVFNEAVGSSCITCKSPDRISESNPYGFISNFEGASRCLTNTIEEMNWIIEHFNDISIFNYGTVSSLSDSDKEFIRSCSYENKLLPYLTDVRCPDLFVFDHGHNDSINDIKESYYDETVVLSGTEEIGWYSSGKHQDSSTKQSIKFDVSNYSQVLLTGKIGAWRDAYDLFDAKGNNLGFEKVNKGVAVDYTEYEIDVKNAKYLVVSNDNNLLSTVSLKAYKYDRNHNLYCYQGAMRFLLNLIFSFDQKQRVVMIGEYENEVRPYIAKYQNKVADEWKLPIYRQWEEYGWSNNKIKTKWHWNNGVWTLGTKEQTITILNCWLADTVHPHSDSSGKTLQFMADHIASWLKNNIFLLN